MLGIFAFQWNNVLCESFCGHITIIARSLEDARANYEKFLEEYAKEPNAVEFDYIGDLPIGDSCSAILDKNPNSVMDLTHIFKGKALIIGCSGSS